MVYADIAENRRKSRRLLYSDHFAEKRAIASARETIVMLDSRWIAGLFVLLAVWLVYAFPLVGEESPLRAPVATGASIEMRELDGRIGPEWDDAARQPLILGPYAATPYRQRPAR